MYMFKKRLQCQPQKGHSNTSVVKMSAQTNTKKGLFLTLNAICENRE